MTAKELLNRMPAALDSEAAGDTEAVVQYEISEPTYQVLKDGRLTVVEGRAQNPDLVIEVSDDNLVKLFKGELNPMTAFMSGEVKLRGDVNLAQRLVGFVDRERVENLS